MPTDTDLGELLLRWEESRQQGRTVSIAELCAARPDLAEELERRIRAVEAMERRFGMGEATVDSGPSDASAAEGTRKNHDLPPVPPQIPGYEVLELLGQGGMGVVYKARHVQLKRLVALKMVRSESHVRHLARFRVEAEAVARLQHPNIVQIYDVGDSEGRPYFSMEYVDGGSLAQRLDGGPLPPRQAAKLVATLADAVHFAHQRGVIHRDLKPANVLVSRGPGAGKQEMVHHTPATTQVGLTTGDAPLPPQQIKITDFGLAKRLDGDSHLSSAGGPTQSGVILGTPSYMAPEQASGKTREVGTAVDVYALGAILYEMLTGRPPFRGESPMDTLLQVMSRDPVPPTREQPRVPRDLEIICLKCLEKSPAHRYASAAALADDLRRYLDGQPIAARPISLPRRLLKWARRRPEVATLAGVLFCALVGLGARAAWVHYQEQQEPQQTAVRLAPRARQLLQQYCYSCHGQDPKHIEGNLDVLQYHVLVDPERDPRLVVRQDVAASYLIHRIEDGTMPPRKEEEFPRMSSDELEVLKKWVAGGAPPWPDPVPDEPPEQQPTPRSTAVKEIFRAHCQECHNIEEPRKGIIILNHDLLVAKRKVVIPGDPQQSVLFQTLFLKDPKKRMPPPDMDELTSDEINQIRRWIAEGAAPFPREHKAWKGKGAEGGKAGG
jgi:serine/threonine protein kinase